MLDESETREGICRRIEVNDNTEYCPKISSHLISSFFNKTSKYERKPVLLILKIKFKFKSHDSFHCVLEVFHYKCLS